MKGKLVAVLFVVVFVLLIAVVFSLLTDDQDHTDINDFRIQAQTTDSPILQPIDTPQPSYQPQAEPTWLPLPTVAPTPFVPTPAPTPIPTPTPTPVPIITDLGAGSFRSASPVYLNVIADWSAKAIDANTVAVTVKISAESYSLHLSRSIGAVHVSLGDQYQSLDAPDLIYDGGLGVNELASTTFTVPLPAGSSNSYSLNVAWHFGGWYMNMEIPSLECGGTITLFR